MTRRAAATDESTPPDIATRTRSLTTVSRSARSAQLPRLLHEQRKHFRDAADAFLRRKRAEAQPNRCAGEVGSYAKGEEDYAKYANDQKMLGADTVEMIIRDDQYKTDVTKRNFEEFLSQGIVIYLNYSTGSTLALKRDFDEEKMPTLPASFDRTNLEKADLRTANNYTIDPAINRVKKARFAYPGVLGLLRNYDLRID